MTEKEKIQKAEFRLQGRCKECNRLVEEFDHATGCSIGTAEWLERYRIEL